MEKEMVPPGGQQLTAIILGLINNGRTHPVVFMKQNKVAASMLDRWIDRYLCVRLGTIHIEGVAARTHLPLRPVEVDDDGDVGDVKHVGLMRAECL